MLEQAEDKAARAAVEGRLSGLRLCEIYVDVDAPNTNNPDEVEWNDGSRIVIIADRFHVGDEPWPYTIPPTNQHADLTIIETPYSGDVEANTEYARACLLDSLRRGEAPIASHLLHTQVLDDMQPDGRSLGIEAGLAWYRVATKCVVYTDRGISGGMRKGLVRAMQHDVAVEYRSIEKRAAA